MPGRKDEAMGTIKKTIGKATGNKKLTNEGRRQKAVGKVKGKIEDATKRVKGAVHGAKE
jgi:uncharacterized protein YjbJ (UPF0337 family)